MSTWNITWIGTIYEQHFEKVKSAIHIYININGKLKNNGPGFTKLLKIGYTSPS